MPQTISVSLTHFIKDLKLLQFENLQFGSFDLDLTYQTFTVNLGGAARVKVHEHQTSQ